VKCTRGIEKRPSEGDNLCVKKEISHAPEERESLDL
jgi:hypothetical protein